MSSLKSLKKKIQAYKNNDTKDVFIEIYEALEWIINILNEE